MPFWKPFYLTIESRKVVDYSLSQHQQLLETGGQLCKLLFRNLKGEDIGTVETPIPIVTWDDSTSSSPRKIIWKEGDETVKYPDPNTIKVFVGGVELKQTYSYETVQNDDEFYVEIQQNLIDYDDNVSVYLNEDFDISGKAISYMYSTGNKNVSIYNLQPQDDAVMYRSGYGFTQYVNASSTFRGTSYPNTILISFPPPPGFDTKFYGFGKMEEWHGRAWTLGEPKLSEFDVVYRVSDQRWYEIKNWEPNYLHYKDEWKLLTQSFELTQLAQNDVIRKFPLI